MATIKDIAREAGVSLATVSHVLNGTRAVSPELVEEIPNVGYCRLARQLAEIVLARAAETRTRLEMLGAVARG